MTTCWVIAACHQRKAMWTASATIPHGKARSPTRTSAAKSFNIAGASRKDKAATVGISTPTYKILGFVSDGHRLSNGWARFRVYGSVPDLRRLLEGGQFAEPIDEIRGTKGPPTAAAKQVGVNSVL